MTKIKRLTPSDREELRKTLTYAFKSASEAKHFETVLPKMWLNDEQFLPRYFTTVKDGKTVAALGVYTYPVVIGDTQLLFATVGNIGTTPEARQKGYMQQLILLAMEELERLNVDVSRLSGLRTRYEPCGTLYRLTLTNAMRPTKKCEQNFTFSKLLATDSENIAFVRSIYESEPIHFVRGNDKFFYAIPTSWNCETYIAYCNGQKVGYITDTPNGNYLPKYSAVAPESTVDMFSFFAYDVTIDELCEILLLPHSNKVLQTMFGICESFKTYFPTHFKVIKPLITLKRQYTALTLGSAVIEINDWGLLKITVDEISATVQKCAPA